MTDSETIRGGIKLVSQNGMITISERIELEWDAQASLPDAPPRHEWIEVSRHSDQKRTFVLTPRTSPGILPDGVRVEVSDSETIRRFTGLYSGGLAQQKRDAGDATAMPPWTEVSWLGKQVVKCPMDLWIYQEIIFETKPDLILETGTAGGGSAFFFATLFDLIGHGHVVTVDKDAYPEQRVQHPRISYLTGDSACNVVAAQMAVAAKDKRTMVSLDSLHTYEHVAAELEIYAPLVSPGCYLVVEDTGWGAPGDDWNSRAVAEFLAERPQFTADETRERHLLTSNRGGWLRRR